MLRIPGEGQEISYGLNMEYEIEVDTPSTETVEADDGSTSTGIVEVGEDASTETVEVAGDTSTEIAEVGKGTSTESVEIKEKINKVQTTKEKMVSPLLEKNIWQAALGELRLQMTKVAFDTWVEHTRLLSCQDNVFVIGAENEFARDWLESRLRTTVERTLVGIVGHPVQVRFVADT
jgi:hypothetical protein